MSDDYTYLPPADPADAALDMEYTYDAPLIELVRPGELSALRAERDALSAQLNGVRSMLESLTPGGSEFVDSPERCVAWFMERSSLVGLIALQRNNLRAERDALRADIHLLVGWLDAVTNGLSVKELAQLPDVCAEVRQRWGIEE